MKDIGKAFSSPFRDPAWVSKFIIAGLFLLLCLFGIGIPVVVGYLVQVTQRVMRREQTVLPEWNDVGVKFVIGFKYCVVVLLYLLPVFLLIIPVIGLGIVSEVSDAPEMISIFATVYLFAFTLLIIPYSLVFTALTPIIAYRYAAREKMGDALDIGGVVRDFRRNWQNTLVVALIAAGIQSFAFIGIILFLIGIVFTIFYSYVVTAAMQGLLYLDAKEEGSNA